MKKLTVIRLEGNYVISEDAEKKLFAIDKSEVPAQVSSGCTLTISNEGEIFVEQPKTTRR